MRAKNSLQCDPLYLKLTFKSKSNPVPSFEVNNFW